MKDKFKNVYLIHGEDEVKISLEKNSLLDKLVPKDQRTQNVSVFSSNSPSYPLKLSKVISDIISEISTTSFFEESRRVILAEDIYELRGSSEKGDSAKQAKTIERIVSFLKNNLVNTSNVIIFTFIEDGDKFRFVDKRGLLYKTINEIGDVIECKQPPIVFEFTDALIDRRQNACVSTFRKMIDNGKSANSIFSLIVKQTRFLLQAKIIGNSSNAKQIEDQLPTEKDVSIVKQHPFIQKKITRASQSFSVQELCKALKELHKIDFYLHPSQNDLYVPDIETVMELFLIKFCRGTI